MKKSIQLTTLLITLSLFTWTTALASMDHNELGFYTDPEMSETHIFTASSSVFDVHMIITNPFNEELGQPIESTNAVEFSYFFPSESAFILTTFWYNGTSFEFSNDGSTHIIGWAEPLLTIDDSIYLGYKTFLVITSEPFGIYLGPSNIPSIPGHMAFLDPGYGLHPLYPTSGSYDDPVFGVNTQVVATERATFDQVKALYR